MINPPASTPPRDVAAGQLRVTLVNHSTVLIQVPGLNVLTDPVWSERVSPVRFAGPRRHRAPGVRITDLPRIDVVLLSHNHYDHLDVSSLQRITREHNPRIYAPVGIGRTLRTHGIRNYSEMDWWEGREVVEGTKLSCTPAQHFSSRTILERLTAKS